MLEDGVLLVRGERFDRDRFDFECSGFRRPGAVASSNEGFLKDDWVGGGSCLEAGMAGGLREAICAVFVAVVETHQQKDGSILIPEPLQPYMKADRIPAP